MGGFIVIDRGMVKHPVVGIRKPGWLAAWVWMLAEASWRRREVNTPQGTIVLERGQFTASIRFMAERVGMTIKGLRVFLSRLKKDGMITSGKIGGQVEDKRTPEKDTAPNQPKGTGQTVITICNYDIYQDVAKSRAQHTPPPGAQLGHSKGTVRAQEGHKLEPCNPVTPESPPIVPHASNGKDIETAFDEWWKQVIRKVAKKKAKALYVAIVRRGEATTTNLLDGIIRYNASDTVARNFIVHPTTWLIQGRWTDRPDPPPPAPPPSPTIQAIRNVK